VDAVLADFSYGLELKGKVDILLFNPPYVPTPSEEIKGNGIEASWAGGVDGREVIDRFLPLIDVQRPNLSCILLEISCST